MIEVCFILEKKEKECKTGNRRLPDKVWMTEGRSQICQTHCISEKDEF